MAVKIQHLRSSTASKRPTTAVLSDGELSINTNLGTSGVFFKDSLGTTVIKVGPAEVGSSAPNVTPASGGSAGNSTGEFWLDTANTGGNSQRALKIYDGTQWQYVGFVTLGSTNVQLGAAATTAITGLTSLTSTSLVANTNIDLANQADLRFYEATGGGTNYVGFQAPAAITADVLWTLPDADATVSGQVLSSNAAGVLSWTNVSTNSISQLNSSVTVTDTGTDGTITFTTDGTSRWTINNSGHLVPSANNTYNLGAPTTGLLSNVYATNLTGTIQTASQPNITGVGTITSGTWSSGLASETFSTSATVTAGTNAQGQGALTTDFNVITTAAAAPSGVTLPTATVGRRVYIVNRGANTVNVYPATGATIDANAVNTSIAVGVNRTMFFWASSATQWYSSSFLVTSSASVSSFSAGTTGFSPNTNTTGTVTLSGTLNVANGGTGQTSYTDGQLLIGNTTGNTLTKATLTQGTGIAITNGSGSISLAVAVTVPTQLTGDSGTATATSRSYGILGGTGLTSTASGTNVTIDLDNTAVTAASYGSASSVATFTVDQQGRLTAAATTSISIVHTQVSDFDAGVQTNRLDQMAAPTASVSLNSQKITNLATPTADTDAANKGYVDSVAQGIDVKASCRVATTAALPTVTYANGTAGVGATLTASAVGVLTIDGIATVLGNRILVKNQATQLQNGIYTVTTEGTAGAAFVLTRSTDMDLAAEFPSAFTFIEEGTSNADSGWVCTTNAPVTVGTTNITFDQFSGAGQITAGAGLTKTGNTLDVNVDSRAAGTKTIAIVSDEVRIDSAWTGQNTITTLGTITTGTWNATAIGLAYGGTGGSNTNITSRHVFMGPAGSNGNAAFREFTTADVNPTTNGSFDAGTY